MEVMDNIKQKKQKQIPNGWVVLDKIGGLGKIFNGLSGKTKVDFGEGEPYIPYVNVFKNSSIDVTEFDLVKVRKGEYQNKVVYGDIIFTTSSETIEEVGMTSVFLDRTNSFYLNSFCFCFRLNDFNTILPEFARYLFRSDKVRYAITLLGQGSTRYNLSKTRLLTELKLSIPKTTTEQQSIASILSKTDQAIDHTQALIAKYTRIKNGLIQDLLTKGIDENGNIRSEQSHEFKDSPLGKIPKEWECITIKDFAERLRSGVTPKGGSDVYEKEGILLIRSQNVYPNGFKLEDVAYINEEINNRMLGSQLKDFDVLLNITGASIGRATYVPEGFPRANVNQHVCSIRLKKANLNRALFLSSYLNSIYGQNQIYQNIAGSNREGINYTQIKEINIPFFNSEFEFDKFSEMITKSNEKINTEMKKLSKLQSLKKGLMQDLLTGKVRVKI